MFASIAKKIMEKSLAPILVGAGLFSSPVHAAILDLELENPSWAKQTVVELGTCVSGSRGQIEFGRRFDMDSPSVRARGS